MTLSNKITLVLILSIIISLPAFASAQSPQLKEYEAHCLEAIQTINAIGADVNNQKYSEAEKAEAEFAYNGFITRYLSINKEHNELLAMNSTNNEEALKNYSKRLDGLMNDLQSYSK